jgi:hypothetical protein
MKASAARKLYYCDLSVTACHALFAGFSVPGFNLKHESPPVAAGGLVLVAETLERPRTNLYLSDHAPALSFPRSTTRCCPVPGGFPETRI